MGEWGLENKNLVILWDGCKVSPYVKHRRGLLVANVAAMVRMG